MTSQRERRSNVQGSKGMTCAGYTEPRLAGLYDALNPPSASWRFYSDLTGMPSKAILDVGCGTGRFACHLAEIGHRVTGADPARAMLDIARRRSGAGRVHWLETDAAGLSVDQRFDLIVMTGHVFQVFLSDDAVGAALEAIHRHLAPGGRLAFESRNPSVSEWKQWTPDLTRERISAAGSGMVEVYYSVTSAEGEFVTFETHFRFSEADHVAVTSTLRFPSQPAIATAQCGAGFTRVEWYGTWDRSGLRADSREIIAVAFEGPS